MATISLTADEISVQCLEVLAPSNDINSSADSQLFDTVQIQERKKIVLLLLLAYEIKFLRRQES